MESLRKLISVYNLSFELRKIKPNVDDEFFNLKQWRGTTKPSSKSICHKSIMSSKNIASCLLPSTSRNRPWWNARWVVASAASVEAPVRGTGRSVGLSDLHDAAVIVRRRIFPGDTRTHHVADASSSGSPERFLPPAAQSRLNISPSTRSTDSRDPGEKRRPSTTLVRDDKCVSDSVVGYMSGEGTREKYDRL